MITYRLGNVTGTTHLGIMHSIPIGTRLAIVSLQRASMRQRKLFMTLAMALMILFSLK